jgi:hypothetical protein
MSGCCRRLQHVRISQTEFADGKTCDVRLWDWSTNRLSWLRADAIAQKTTINFLVLQGQERTIFPSRVLVAAEQGPDRGDQLVWV